jgi:hypothetical protein
MDAYKIVEVVDGQIKTLFHGLNGSRSVPKGKWLEATEVMGKDGTSKTSYLTGWHTLLSLQDAEDYMTSFTKRLDILHIVPCVIGGRIRPKAHSPSPVWLSRWIKFV